MKIAKFYLRPASPLHLRRPPNDETDRGSFCKRGNRRIPDLPHREIANPAAQPFRFAAPPDRPPDGLPVRLSGLASEKAASGRPAAAWFKSL